MTTKSPTAADAPATESLASGEDGTRLYVRARRGPRVTTAVLCDGLACEGFIYKYLWDDLVAHLSVAHWHYRGHGRSALPVDPLRIQVADHAADLDAIRRHLGDPPVILVGHSFGAQVAIEAYRRRPGRIRALVLLCGSVGRVTHTFRGTDLLARMLPEVAAWADRHPRLARGLWGNLPPQLGTFLARVTGDVDARAIQAEDVAPYFDHAAHVDFHLFLRMLAAAGEHTAEPLLPSLDLPVLVVAGDRDSFTPPELAEATAARLPRAELLMVPGGTHVTPLEHRELVALRIEKFLTDHDLLRDEEGRDAPPTLP